MTQTWSGVSWGELPLLRTTALGTANSSAEKTWKQPYRGAHIAKNWGLPKPFEAAILEVDLPALVRPSSDCSEGQYLDCIPLRDCEPEPLNYPAPQFLIHRDCEIINLLKPPNLGVIYYLVIH